MATILVFVSQNASAQTRSDETRRAALIQQATQARSQGRWSSVADLLQQVIEIRATASVRLGLAGALQELGRYQEAATQATLCMQTASTDRDLREEQRTALVDGCGQVLRDSTANLANVTVEVSPEGVTGATLSVDGEPVEGFAAGRPFYLTPGRRRLQLRAPDYVAADTQDTFRAGVPQSVRMRLERSVASTDRAQLSNPIPPSASLSVVPWIIGGVSLATVAVGTGYLLWAQSASDEARALCPAGCPDGATEARAIALNQQQSDRQTIGTTLTIVGGVGAAAAVVWLILRPTPQHSGGQVSVTHNGFSVRF